MWRYYFCRRLAATRHLIGSLKHSYANCYRYLIVLFLSEKPFADDYCIFDLTYIPAKSQWLYRSYVLGDVLKFTVHPRLLPWSIRLAASDGFPFFLRRRGSSDVLSTARRLYIYLVEKNKYFTARIQRSILRNSMY